MIKVACGYCGKETWEFYCCQLPGDSEEGGGEGYCCPECAKKYEGVDGPYVLNMNRLYKNTDPLTPEEQERYNYWHMNSFQKLKYNLKKAKTRLFKSDDSSQKK